MSQISLPFGIQIFDCYAERIVENLLSIGQSGAVFPSIRVRLPWIKLNLQEACMH